MFSSSITLNIPIILITNLLDLYALDTYELENIFDKILFSFCFFYVIVISFHSLNETYE